MASTGIEKIGSYRSGFTSKKSLLTNTSLYWGVVTDVLALNGLYANELVYWYPGMNIGEMQTDEQEPTRQMIPTRRGGTQYMQMQTRVSSIYRLLTFEVTLPPADLGAMRKQLGRFMRNGNQCRLDGFHIMECADYEDSITIVFPDSLFSFKTLGELTNIDDAGQDVRNTTSFEVVDIKMIFGLDAQKRDKVSVPLYGAFPLPSDDCDCTQGCQEIIFVGRDSAVDTAISGFYTTDDALRTAPVLTNLLSTVDSNLITDMVDDSGTLYYTVETHSDGAITFPPATGLTGSLWTVARSGGTPVEIALPESTPANASATFLFQDADGNAVVIGHGINGSTDGLPSVYRGPDFRSLSVINNQDLSVDGEDLIVTSAQIDESTNTIYVVGHTETTNASRLISIQNNAVSNITSQVPIAQLGVGEYLTAVAVVGDDVVLLGTSAGRILETNKASEGATFHLLTTPLAAEPVWAIVGSDHRHMAVTSTKLFERSPNVKPYPFEWTELTNLPELEDIARHFGPRSLVQCEAAANEFNGPNDFYLVSLDGSAIKLENR